MLDGDESQFEFVAESARAMGSQSESGQRRGVPSGAKVAAVVQETRA